MASSSECWASLALALSGTPVCKHHAHTQQAAANHRRMQHAPTLSSAFQLRGLKWMCVAANHQWLGPITCCVSRRTEPVKVRSASKSCAAEPLLGLLCASQCCAVLLRQCQPPRLHRCCQTPHCRCCCCCCRHVLSSAARGTELVLLTPDAPVRSCLCTILCYCSAATT